MSNEYGFFASKNHDRRYSADDFSAFFGDFFTDGVLGFDTSALMVSAAGDMSVSVGAGTAYIKGRWYRRQSPQVLMLEDSDTVYDRIDAVVIRCDFEKRMVYPYVIEGVPDETAAEPDPVRNEKCHDLVLAYIYVAANCVEITAADITDKRGFDDVCGFVTSAIDHIDTSGLFRQYEAQWKLLKAGCSKDAEEVIKAWSLLSTVKTVNDIEPINGNVALTQGLIPSGDSAYQFPYFIQTGTVTTDKTYGSLTVTFPKAYKSPPLLFLTSQNYVGQQYGITANYKSVTNTDFEVYTSYVYNTGSTKYVSATVMWLALGEPAE